MTHKRLGFAKNTSITLVFFVTVLEDLLSDLVIALMKPSNEYSGGF